MEERALAMEAGWAARAARSAHDQQAAHGCGQHYRYSYHTKLRVGSFIRLFFSAHVAAGLFSLHHEVDEGGVRDPLFKVSS